MLKIVVGFDQRESIAYHVFCQSVIEHASGPVSFIPLASQTISGYDENHKDGSNDFIYSRFLTPYLNNFEGWALYVDGDMICLSDIYELLSLKDESKAVMVVKHNYQTVTTKKYFGNKNENYPRKNWSSVILWNCKHQSNKVLTPELIENSTGAFLHRFKWLDDNLIGEIDKSWNWLATEYPDNYEANLVHYTLGTPCLKDYKDANMSDIWHYTFNKAIEGMDG